jgi:hypothetical protein
MTNSDAASAAAHVDGNVPGIDVARRKTGVSFEGPAPYTPAAE